MGLDGSLSSAIADIRVCGSNFRPFLLRFSVSGLPDPTIFRFKDTRESMTVFYDISHYFNWDKLKNYIITILSSKFNFHIL